MSWGLEKQFLILCFVLTHWGRVTHICVNKITIICSDNGLSPGRRQAIIWTNAVLLLIEPLGTNFSEILIAIHIFSSQKMHLNISSAKWRLFCLGLNVLIGIEIYYSHGTPFINTDKLGLEHGQVITPIVLYGCNYSCMPWLRAWIKN